ncbi:MAG: hypothetical protein QM662_08380 [Gordonia sp. (in: high G+C Gram-positive bacteria)]
MVVPLRRLALTALCAASLMVSACTLDVSGAPSAEVGSAAGSGVAGQSSVQVPAVPFPAAPVFTGPAAQCAGQTVVNHHDLNHPGWGPTRLYALTETGRSGTDSRSEAGSACLVAVDGQGATRWAYSENIHYEWNLATPASDVTGHIFVIYNPGRYRGVIVLIPTPAGFAPFSHDYRTGLNRYYSAELIGPDPTIGYSITLSANDCSPTCADGTVSTRTIHWNGSAYVE